jgi:hypothetical protein
VAGRFGAVFLWLIDVVINEMQGGGLKINECRTALEGAGFDPSLGVGGGAYQSHI